MSGARQDKEIESARIMLGLLESVERDRAQSAPSGCRRAAPTAAKTPCWEAQSGPMIEAFYRAMREAGAMHHGMA